MNEILKLNPNGTVTLCARKTCCPIMEDLGGGKVKITDDDGSSIVITKEQASLLGAGIEALNEKDLQLLNE
jgi:hypothetical protein